MKFGLMLIILILILILVVVSLKWCGVNCPGHHENFGDNNYKIVVSLTTLPDRIGTTHVKETIKLLKDQNLKPDKILLNIPYKCKRNNKKYIIPEWMKKDKMIHINRCKDEGPATKVLGGIGILDDNTLLVIVDDDMHYKPHLIQNLVKKWKSNKNSIVAVVLNRERPNHLYSFNHIEGYGSYLVHKKLIKDIKKFKKPETCFNVDDTWLSWCYHKLNIPAVRVDNNTEDFGYSYRYKKGDWGDWFMLKVTDRNKDTKMCVNDLKKL